MKRNRGYFRTQRKRAIHRKMAIQTKRMGRSLTDEIYNPSRRGQLAKGKIHCSCAMCRRKSYDELSHRDKVKKVQAEFQLKSYFAEE